MTADNEGPTRLVSSRALTTQLGTRQLVSKATSSRLMSRVTRDTMTTLDSVVDAEKERTWRIGGHGFSDGAYQQLLRLLCEIRSPEGPRMVDALVNHLQQGFDDNAKEYTPSWVIDGHLKAIVLHSLGMRKFDFGNVSGLRYLDCSDNELSELELSCVPELAVLICDKNLLSDLNLSSVPSLNWLYCFENELTELNLANVPNLFGLVCDDNKLTKLELSNIPELEFLYCCRNHLTELDLSNVPSLTELECYENRVAELDISSCLKLKEVTCDASVVVHKRPDQTARRA